MTIKIDRINGVYVGRCTYNERFTLKRAGFEFKDKQWVTTDDEVASSLYEFCVANAKQRLDGLTKVKRQLIEASYADTYDGELKSPDGLNYLPFQRAGIAFALERDNTLIGDSPGLGKTMQALGVINNVPGAKNILIVVPASLKINWFKEASKWVRSELNLDIEIAYTETKIIKNEDGSRSTKRSYVWPDANIIIINYDMLEKYYKEIRSKTWDILICDEAHVLKNSNTTKTKHVFGSKSKKKGDKLITPITARKKVFLTGTPILNKPLDMYGMICYFGFEKKFGSYVKFIQDYCDAYITPWKTWDTSGTSNLKRFQEFLRVTFMIRRLKDDVLKELPPKRRQIVTFSNEGLSKVVKKEKQVFADNLKALMILNGEKTEEDYREPTDDELRRLIDGIHEKTRWFTSEEDFSNYESQHFEAVSQIREEIGISKIPLMVEYLKTFTDAGEKVVFLCNHRIVAHKVVEAFGNQAVKYIGGMSEKEKNESVERFQNDPDCMVFGGNISSAGVGLTLIAASNLVMGELCFVPALLEQGEDRIHRIGQQNHALIHYLIVEGSLEERLMEIVLEKMKMIKEALDRMEN